MVIPLTATLVYTVLFEYCTSIVYNTVKSVTARLKYLDIILPVHIAVVSSYTL